MHNHQEEKNTFRSSQEFKEHQLNPNHSKEQLLDLIPQIKQFTFLTLQNNSQPFTFTKEFPNQFSTIKDKYSLIFTTIIAEDSNVESINLNQTIQSLLLNLPSLNTLSISPSNALYVIFIQKFNHQENHDLFYGSLTEQNKINRQLYEGSFMSYASHRSPAGSSGIDLLILHKPKLTAIEFLDLFYNNILLSIKGNKSTMYIIQLTNGIILSSTGIYDMINKCNHKTIAVVPQIQTISTGLYAQIDHYAQYQYTIYDLQYYLSAHCLPMNNDLILIKINPQTIEDVKAYFNNQICFDADINYHNLVFSLYLQDREYTICYAKDIICHFNKTNITFGEMMTNQINRNSGLYAAIFDLIKYWTYCGRMKNSFTGKLMMMILFIGMFFDFCFPSMMSIIIYTIFNEAFESNDPRVSIFLTTFYILMTLLSITFSLISKKYHSKTEKIFIAMYVIFTVFYIFAIVCAIPAIHFVNINKKGDKYMFNVPAFASMIAINVFFGLLPLLLNAKTFGKNILSGIEYLILGIPGYTSVFLNHAIVNCSDMIGTVKNKKDFENNKEKDKTLENYRKMLMFVLYGCTNGFFLCIIFFLTNRTMRVNGVYSIAIIYTIYNCIKIIGLMIGIFKSPKKNNVDDMLPENDNNDDVNIDVKAGNKIKIKGQDYIEDKIKEKNKEANALNKDNEDKEINKGIHTEPQIMRFEDLKKIQELTEERINQTKSFHYDNSNDIIQGRLNFKNGVNQLKEKSIELNFEDDVNSNIIKANNPITIPEKKFSQEKKITKDNPQCDWITDVNNNVNEYNELRFTHSNENINNIAKLKSGKENGINQDKETHDEILDKQKEKEENDKEKEDDKEKEIDKEKEDDKEKDIDNEKDKEVEKDKEIIEKQEFIIDELNQQKIDNFILIDSQDYEIQQNKDITKSNQNAQEKNTEKNDIEFFIEQKEIIDNKIDKQSYCSIKQNPKNIKEKSIDKHFENNKDSHSSKSIDNHFNKEKDNANLFLINQASNEHFNFEVINNQNNKENDFHIEPEIQELDQALKKEEQNYNIDSLEELK